MIIGTNKFSVLVTDVSGNTVNTSAGWVVYGRAGDMLIFNDAPTVVVDPSGFHMVSVEIPQTGAGYVAFKNGSYSITPTYYDFVANISDVDTVYAAIQRQANDGQQIYLGNYEELDAGKFKRGDDIQFTYIVPDSIAVDISGWTQWQAQLRPAAARTSDISSYTTCYLSVDTVTKSIAVTIPASASSLLVIEEGQNSSVYYSDIQALTISNKIKTVTEIALTITRDITRA